MNETWELKKATYKIVNELVQLKKGEEVLIYADTKIDTEIVDATAEQAYIAGARPIIMWYETLTNVGEEPPRVVAEAMKNADAIIEYASRFLYITKAYSNAINAGARHLCLTGMTKEMMVRCIANVNTTTLEQFGTVLTNLTKNAKKMRIKTEKGTDLVFEMDGRPVFLDTGITTKDHQESFLGGQISWAPIEETIEGKMVIDGSIWPPDTLGKLRDPVTLTIEKGKIVEFSKNVEGRIFKGYLDGFKDKNMYNIAHACYGFNPGARLSGNILEDERVFGAVEFGFGSQGSSFLGNAGPAKSHTDGIILAPTVWLDNVKIEENGVYTHPKLKSLSEKLLKNTL
ncbi:MAG: aminopeptidase [Thermoplasmata archaeon]